ncbi:DNA cytosine methyltransferase [Streptomyces sp. TRM 70351]|uniref:DNA cytosine methyltransferase n=1 Tax=Streptomyces sp. TRM 70351 TaxID=3116552 RepID=UPI002E7B9332|nr:DNA cytosine methyltransferase [Streptomyces sp. TRM 70351]MEE1929779.1 DNA cytosine methyltransferase [Streptomyces sp. TRM 70351]
MSSTDSTLTSVEICAGAGGQAVGLHQAGFQHLALIEIDGSACDTLRLNVTEEAGWGDCEILQEDLNQFDPAVLGLKEGELGLLAGGVPCPPFSSAGLQLGENDERDLFPVMLDLVDYLKPRAVMIENVRGLLQPPDKFRRYRDEVIRRRLTEAGYVICGWEVIEACDYGVPQLRPRAILVAMRPEFAGHFSWPDPGDVEMVTVYDALHESMKRRFGDSPEGRKAYDRWSAKARGGIAPTLVGGSKKHGGADLGPTRAKSAWRKLGVDAMGVANEPHEMKDPERDLYARDREGVPIGPKLTVSQAALVQGFPADWKFSGRKTAAYRQVGNAFPPPVARAIGQQIALALEKGTHTPSTLELPPHPEEHCTLFDIPGTTLGARFGDRVHDLESTVVR